MRLNKFAQNSFLLMSLGLSNQVLAQLLSMDDSALSAVSGEGIGAVLQDVSLYSDDYKTEAELAGVNAEDRPFRIFLNLGGGDTATTVDDTVYTISELRLNRSGATPGEVNSGGFIGNPNDPFYLGDIQELTKSDGTNYTGLITAFPGSEIKQANPYKINPSFSSGNNTVAYFIDNSQYSSDLTKFESNIAKASSEFDLHLRVDSFVGARPVTDKFEFYTDIKNFQFFGTEFNTWAEPTHGVAISSSVGIVADEIIITQMPKDAGGNYNVDSQITINGLNAYLPISSVDQPLVFRTVDGVDGSGAAKQQLQLEIMPLTPEVALKRGSNIDKGYLYIKSLDFGAKNNPDLFTANDQFGNAQYAFTPQFSSQNVIEAKGIDIQHLRITTMDIPGT